MALLLTKATRASTACLARTRRSRSSSRTQRGRRADPLLPTGNVVDQIAGIRVTCIDNGMPVVCINAADVGLTGSETPAEIEARDDVRKRVEEVRLAAGPLMNLGDVTSQDGAEDEPAVPRR